MWNDADVAAVRSLCEAAVSLAFVPNRDVVFMPGALAEQAYYVMRGRLRYTQVPESSMVLQDMQTEVQQGVWLCEAALWTDWEHVGMLEARVSCQLLSVNATGLLRVLQRHATVSAMTKSYGRNFHTRLVSARPPHAEWPTDLHVPYTIPSELLSQHVGIALLRHARRSGMVSLPAAQLEKLSEEVRCGLCSVQHSKDGSGLQRIVTLVALRIEQDGLTFMQVGKWDCARGRPRSCRTRRSGGCWPKSWRPWSPTSTSTARSAQSSTRTLPSTACPRCTCGRCTARGWSCTGARSR